uniref:Transcriptional regulator n=1 Tax=Steinernema glaseri TaxID=37863 RepID=A0A1I8AK66_9BILA
MTSTERSQVIGDNRVSFGEGMDPADMQDMMDLMVYAEMYASKAVGQHASPQAWNEFHHACLLRHGCRLISFLSSVSTAAHDLAQVRAFEVTVVQRDTEVLFHQVISQSLRDLDLETKARRHFESSAMPRRDVEKAMHCKVTPCFTDRRNQPMLCFCGLVMRFKVDVEHGFLTDTYRRYVTLTPHGGCYLFDRQAYASHRTFVLAQTRALSEDDLRRQGAHEQAHQPADDLQALVAKQPFDAVRQKQHQANGEAGQGDTHDGQQLVVPVRLADAHHQQRTDGAGADGQRDGQRHDGHVLLHVVGVDRRLALGHAQRRDEQHAAGADAKSVGGDAEDAEDCPSEQHRHLAVHQHQVVALRLHGLQGFLAVAGGVGLQVELAEHAADHLGGDVVVFGHQDAEVGGHVQRGGQAGRLHAEHLALAALGQFFGQGSLEGVAGHGLGQDALDPGVAGDDLARRIGDAGEHDDQDVVVQARIFLDLGGQLHAGHAGHVLVEQHGIEVVAQVRLGAQQGQGFLARGHGAHVHAPGAALLHQHLAAGVVVVHHQHPGIAQR